MKIETLLKTALMLLVVALAVVITSWFTGSRNAALAEGGGVSGGSWIMVASELREGEGLIYMFNTEKEVLLVYAYHRGRIGVGANNRAFTGDLQFLAGRHCKWDLLYSVRQPYNPSGPQTKSEMHSPMDMKKAYEKVSKEEEK